jgi:hypothetical protein
MDRVILLYFSGLVSEKFDLVGIRPHVLTFQKLPSFNELVARVRAVMNVGCDLRLHRRYDMGGNRLIYVMLPDNTSIFAWTRGPLKIKDQAARIAHEDVGPSMYHMKSPIITLG